MGGIDEAALDKLSLVTEMTKRIRVRSGKLFRACVPASLQPVTALCHVYGNIKSQYIVKASKLLCYTENSNEADLASFTPAFLWLLRDFYLSLEEDGQTVCWLPCCCSCCMPLESAFHHS